MLTLKAYLSQGSYEAAPMEHTALEHGAQAQTPSWVSLQTGVHREGIL